MNSYRSSNALEVELSPIGQVNEDLSMIDFSERLALEVLMARLDDCFVEEEGDSEW
jgi:hypothetical protein